MRTLLTTMFCLALSLPARSQSFDINLDALLDRRKFQGFVDHDCRLVLVDGPDALGPPPSLSRPEVIVEDVNLFEADISDFVFDF